MTTMIISTISYKLNNYVSLYIRIHYIMKNPEINNNERPIQQAMFDFV